MISKINKFLKKLFSYPEEFIKNNNIKTNIRKSKITINDCIFYRFKYTFADISNTFESITSFINFNNLENNKKHKRFTRIAIYKKEKILPLELYKIMFNKTIKFYYNNFKDNDIIIAIDGVYSNTNILHNGTIETSMSLGFYDNINNIPLDIHFTGVGKKNNECLSLMNYISTNIEQFKDKIIICDRAYYCYKFFNFLIENNIKFIIRLRDAAGETIPNKYAKHYKDFMRIKDNKNVRIVVKKFKTAKLAVNDSNSSNTIEKETIIKLITNLNNLDHYNDDKILELYKSRWNIEEFYKQLKHNFKFQYLSEHKEENYKKNIYASLTTTVIKQILLKCYENITEFKNKTITSKHKDSKIKIKKSINENLILTGIKDVLLRDIVYKKLNNDTILNFLNSYIVVHISEEDRHFKRQSKRPFTKWYVKQYHDIYKIKKKCLDEEIKLFLKNGDNEILEKLKKKRKELIKEHKKVNKEIKDNQKNNIKK